MKGRHKERRTSIDRCHRTKKVQYSSADLGIIPILTRIPYTAGEATSYNIGSTRYITLLYNIACHVPGMVMAGSKELRE